MSFPPIDTSETKDLVHYTQAIDFDTVGIAAGVPLLGYRPRAGDVVVGAWFEVTTLFDGTTPLGDFFMSGTATTGLLANTMAAADLSAADAATATANLTQNATNQAIATGVATVGGAGFPWVTADADVCLLVISQTGLKGGAAIGGTAGSAVAHLVVLPASQER